MRCEAGDRAGDGPTVLAGLLAFRGIVTDESRVADLADLLSERQAGRPRPIAVRTVDVVLADDVFPGLQTRGSAAVGAAFAAAAHVLGRGGHLVILGFSGRSDVALDCRDVVDGSHAHGFVVEELGERPFGETGAALFHLRKAIG